MKVQVNAKLCALTGFCASIAPEVFDVAYGHADSARVIVEEINEPEVAGRVREAVESCPVSAISLDD